MRTSVQIGSSPVSVSPLAAEGPLDRDEISPALWKMLERTLREGRMSRRAMEAELFKAAFDDDARV